MADNPTTGRLWPDQVIIRVFTGPDWAPRLIPPAWPSLGPIREAWGRDQGLWGKQVIIGSQRLKEISVVIGNSKAMQGPADNRPTSLRKRTLIPI